MKRKNFCIVMLCCLALSSITACSKGTKSPVASMITPTVTPEPSVKLTAPYQLPAVINYQDQCYIQDSEFQLSDADLSALEFLGEITETISGTLTLTKDMQTNMSCLVPTPLFRYQDDERLIVEVNQAIDDQGQYSHQYLQFTKLRSPLKTDMCLTLLITEVQEDGFIANNPLSAPSKYHVDMKLPDSYCVNDFVDVYYDSLTEDKSGFRVEVSALAIVDSSIAKVDGVDYKPVIYLYPLQPTDISVRIDYKGVLTLTDPPYEDGWRVTAYPEGTIMTAAGRCYPYLFWEGESDTKYDMSKGFCIAGEQTEEFLREKLSYLGLNTKETEEFLQFWVPVLKKNPYNQISFQTTAYTDSAELIIDPKPDTLLRIFMVYQPLKEAIKIEEQELTPCKRIGFTVVEWGGAIQTKESHQRIE